MLRVCRICFSEICENDKLQDFTHNDMCYGDLIKEYIGLELIQKDHFPFLICSLCNSDLMVVVNFVTKCRISNKKLQEFTDPDVPFIDFVKKPSKDENKDLVVEFDVPIKDEDVSDADTCLDNTESVINYDDVSECAKTKVKIKKKQKRKVINKGKTNISELKCNICGVFKQSKSILEIHLRTHTGEKPYNCKECEKSFAQKSTYDQHIWRKHKRNLYLEKNSFVCDVCGKQSFNKSDLKVHIRIHTKEKPYKCTFCPKSFSQTGSLRQHIRMHTGERPFQCDLCKKCFRSQTDLQKHKTVHSDYRKYACHMCDKRFKTRDVYRTHIVLHTSERTFVCDKCGTSFNQKNTLTSHIRNMHSEASGTCNICHKLFPSLAEHMRVHTREVAYKCEICGKGFVTKRSHSIHIKNHNEATKYPCTENKCEAAFPTQRQLKHHTWKFHRSFFPHECDMCSKGFIRLSDLTRHKKFCINNKKKNQYPIE